MELTPEEIKKIAKLARVEISDAEVPKFQAQLSEILNKAKMLDEVDTTNVEPIAQITGLKNVSYKDEVEEKKLQDALLEQSPMPIQGHMLKVKNIL